MPTTRDTQRKRVYDAETALFRDAATHPGDSAAAKRLLHQGARVTSTGNITIEACQAYVDHLIRSAWFQRRWPEVARRGVTCRHKVYGNATWSPSGYISLPPWARDEATILHEVAHAVTPREVAHGPEYAAAMLALVGHRMGPEAAKALREQYREHRVRIAAAPKPNTRVAVIPRADQERNAAAAKRAERQRAAREQEAARARHRLRLLSRDAATEAEAVIRELVAIGAFGESGTKSRRAALDVARALNSPATARARLQAVPALRAVRDA